MGTERIIGVDFGTSTSVIRVKRYTNGAPVGDNIIPVTFNMGRTVVPTLIRKIGEDEAYYGFDAEPNRKKSVVYRNFKMNLESENEQLRNEAKQLTREFFGYMAETYLAQSRDGHLGEANDSERTIVSYPVKWSEETRAFMVSAAQEAGFPNVEGMDEAQAAIHAIVTQNMDSFSKKSFVADRKNVKVLLIDMGAGTTDLVLCSCDIDERKTEIICAWPKGEAAFFGGREIDEILKRYIELKLPVNDAAEIMKRCGIEKFKAWKEQIVAPELNRNGAISEFGEVDNIAGYLGVEVEAFNLTRNEFEMTAREYLKQFPALVKGCITEAGIDESEIDIVVLTGGHSQWYFVKDMLLGKSEEFGEINLPKIKKNSKRIVTITLPQETVALGLVYSAMKIQKPVEVVSRKVKESEREKFLYFVKQRLITFIKKNKIVKAGEGAFSNKNFAENRSQLGIWKHEDVFLYHDDDLLGAGKSGFALAGCGIYVRQAGGEAICIKWEKFIEEDVKDGMKVGVNSCCCISDTGEVGTYVKTKFFPELQKFLLDEINKEIPQVFK